MAIQDIRAKRKIKAIYDSEGHTEKCVSEMSLCACPPILPTLSVARHAEAQSPIPKSGSQTPSERGSCTQLAVYATHLGSQQISLQWHMSGLRDSVCLEVEA